MPDWSIMIVTTSGGVKFQPDIEDAEPGDPLEVEQGDLVSWNNTTDQTYRPIATTPLFIGGTSPPVPAQLTASPIQPHSPSPYFNVTQPTGTTIDYICEGHPEIQGRIVVVPFGHISTKAVA